MLVGRQFRPGLFAVGAFDMGTLEIQLAVNNDRMALGAADLQADQLGTSIITDLDAEEGLVENVAGYQWRGIIMIGRLVPGHK